MMNLADFWMAGAMTGISGVHSSTMLIFHLLVFRSLFYVSFAIIRVPAYSAKKLLVHN
jgi:hypothetical protein